MPKGAPTRKATESDSYIFFARFCSCLVLLPLAPAPPPQRPPHPPRCHRFSFQLFQCIRLHCYSTSSQPASVPSFIPSLTLTSALALPDPKGSPGPAGLPEARRPARPSTQTSEPPRPDAPVIVAASLRMPTRTPSVQPGRYSATAQSESKAEPKNAEVERKLRELKVSCADACACATSLGGTLALVSPHIRRPRRQSGIYGQRRQAGRGGDPAERYGDCQRPGP